MMGERDYSNTFFEFLLTGQGECHLYSPILSPGGPHGLLFSYLNHSRYNGHTGFYY